MTQSVLISVVSVLLTALAGIVGIIIKAEYDRRSKQSEVNSEQVEKNTIGLAALETEKLKDARLNVQDLQREVMSLRDRLDVSERGLRAEVVSNAQNLIKVNTDLAEVRATSKLQALQIDLLNERLLNATRERDDSRARADQERAEFEKKLLDAQRRVKELEPLVPRVKELEAEVERLKQYNKDTATP